MEAEILRLRENLHLEDRVLLPGIISHNELPHILAEHDIFAAPCVVHASGRRDGIPNTVIEALAYGLPVVSTTVNALPEVVRNGETGLAVPPNDPVALADAIEQMADNADLADRLAHNGRKMAADMQQGNPSTEQMFIVAPMFAVGGMANLFSTHPPLEERIRRLREMAASNR